MNNKGTGNHHYQYDIDQANNIVLRIGRILDRIGKLKRKPSWLYMGLIEVYSRSQQVLGEAERRKEMLDESDN